MTQFISTILLLCIIWIIIKFLSSSSSIHLHMDLDHHHWIYIITRSRLSLLDHHHWIWIITGFGLSLDLEHPWIWIISGSGSSLLDHHHRCYLSILLVIVSSTKPDHFFYAGCRPSVHVGLYLLQHLYLIQ